MTAVIWKVNAGQPLPKLAKRSYRALARWGNWLRHFPEVSTLTAYRRLAFEFLLAEAPRKDLDALERSGWLPRGTVQHFDDVKRAFDSIRPERIRRRSAAGPRHRRRRKFEGLLFALRPFIFVAAVVTTAVTAVLLISGAWL